MEQRKDPKFFSLFDFRGTIGEKDDHGHAEQKKAGFVSVNKALSRESWGQLAQDEEYERLNRNDKKRRRISLDNLAWAGIDGKPMFEPDGPN